MSVEILGGDSFAVLTCNTTDWAFGPVFASREHAEDFCRWLRARAGAENDPRLYSDDLLESMVGLWRRERVDADGELIDDEGAVT